MDKYRPKLGRSCRCIFMLGHGYESVVELFYFLPKNNLNKINFTPKDSFRLFFRLLKTPLYSELKLE